MRVSGFRRAVLLTVGVAAAISAAACGDVKDPITFNPTPVTFTETFGGTLTTGGSNFHPFINSVAGTVTMRLTTVSPDSAQLLGFYIGTWDGTACYPIFGTGTKDASQGYAFAGSAIAANFCLRVYDDGRRIPADTTVTYAATVEHR